MAGTSPGELESSHQRDDNWRGDDAIVKSMNSTDEKEIVSIEDVSKELPPPSSKKPERTDTDTPTSIQAHDSILWHDASRDWRAMAGFIIILMILVAIAVWITDVLRNFVLQLFIISFIGFLGIIVLYLFYQASRLKDYSAFYLGHRGDQEELVKHLLQEMESSDIRTQETDSVVGHTFGLLHTITTLKTEEEGILEVCEVHFSNSGVTMGTYLITKSGENSKLRRIVNAFLEKELSTVRPIRW